MSYKDFIFNNRIKNKKTGIITIECDGKLHSNDYDMVWFDSCAQINKNDINDFIKTIELSNNPKSLFYITVSLSTRSLGGYSKIIKDLVNDPKVSDVRYALITYISNELKKRFDSKENINIITDITYRTGTKSNRVMYTLGISKGVDVNDIRMFSYNQVPINKEIVKFSDKKLKEISKSIKVPNIKYNNGIPIKMKNIDSEIVKEKPSKVKKNNDIELKHEIIKSFKIKALKLYPVCTNFENFYNIEINLTKLIKKEIADEFECKLNKVSSILAWEMGIGGLKRKSKK